MLVGVGVNIALGVEVFMAVGVSVAVFVGVAVNVFLGVGVGVRKMPPRLLRSARRQAMMKRRKIIRIRGRCFFFMIFFAFPILRV